MSIHSAQENEFVRRLLGNKEVFVGFSDSDVETTFVWVDGSSVKYTNWEAGEPDDDYGMGDCVIVIGTTGKWNDTPCIMWYEFMCKFTDAQPSVGKGNFLFLLEGALRYAYIISHPPSSYIIFHVFLPHPHPSSSYVNICLFHLV